MQEITELNITRQQLAAEHIYYYDGCKTETLCQESADDMTELAADVLIQILMSQISPKTE